MASRCLAPLAVLAVALAVAPAVQADVLSGSFSSIATNSNYGGPGSTPISFDGSTVIGMFDISSVAGAQNIYPGGYIGILETLTFDVIALGQVYAFSDQLDFIGLSDNGTTQELQIAPDFANPHVFTNIVLSGPEGSLFTNINDPRSISPTSSAISVESPAGFDVYDFLFTDLIITGTQVTGVPADEPPGWAVLALPLGVLAARRVRTQNAAGT